MSRRGKIRLASYFCALVVVLSTAIAACHVGAGGYTTQIDAQTTRAFGEAFSAVERMRRTLERCAYASDAPMQSAVCTQLYADSLAAETALSCLPVELDALEHVSQHISVAGDYACLLSRLTADGHTIPADDREQLLSFSEAIRSFSDSLDQIRTSESLGELIPESRGRLTDALDNLESETGSVIRTLNDAFRDLAADFPETEPLQYDGRFSDHHGDRASRISGKPIMTQADARQRAADFLSCGAEQLRALEMTEGEIPCWRFSDKDQTVIDVTVQGGEILRFLSDCTANADADPEAATAIGSAFLQQHGYRDMKPVEVLPGGGVVTITFVPVVEEVLCLPDRVTLKICSSSEQVTAFDASGYLKHHKLRTFPESTASWTPPEALTVEAQRKIVLLSPGGQERFCTEYLFKSQDGTPVRIAVHAETGLQEQIVVGDEPMQTVD